MSYHHLDSTFDNLVVEETAVQLLHARGSLVLLPRQEVLHQQLPKNKTHTHARTRMVDGSTVLLWRDC